MKLDIELVHVILRPCNYIPYAYFEKVRVSCRNRMHTSCLMNSCAAMITAGSIDDAKTHQVLPITTVLASRP